MRVVYCRSCREVSTKSRFERDTCNRCGRDAVPVRTRRPWQYYASSAVILVAAAYLFLVDLPDLLPRLAIFVAALAIAVALSAWSLRSLRARVRESMEDAEGTPEGRP